MLGLIGIGGVLLVAAAVLLTTVSLGRSATERVGSDGKVVFETHATASVFESSPRAALVWIAVAVGVAVVFGLLICFGRTPGALVVVLIAALALFASMLSIGIFLAPGLAAFVAAAMITIIERSAARRS